MKRNRGKIAGLLLTVCACAALYMAGAVLDGKKTACIVDKDGKMIAELSVIDGELKYNCEEGYEVYADMACRETVELIDSLNETDDPQKWIVDNGLVIRTFMDEDAMEAVHRAYDEAGILPYGQTAAMVSDTQGNILACAGGSQEENSTNPAATPAYAGSVIKPLSVYGPAIEKGTVNWSTLYEDSPDIWLKDEAGNEKPWPENTGPYTYEDITVRKALEESNNVVAVKVLQDYGAGEACRFLSDNFGISTEREQELLQSEGEERILSNIALGYLENGVTVRQILASYQVFANGGVYYEPAVVSDLEKDGESLGVVPSREGKRVFSEETAYIMNRLLREVVLNGTGQAAQTDAAEVCGKTGTSGYGDHWFAGITPEHVCCIWYKERTEDRQEIYQEGGRETVLMFRNIIESIEQSGKASYKQPEGVREEMYCKKSGLAAGEMCREKAVGYYKKAELPGRCTLCG